MGLAASVREETGTICGTPAYMAPEMMDEIPYTCSVDMFSVGIILWEMWQGQRAQSCYTEKDLSIAEFWMQMQEGVLRPGNGKFAGEEISDWSSDELDVVSNRDRAKAWASLAKDCWSSVPAVRPSADDAYAMLTAFRLD